MARNSEIAAQTERLIFLLGQIMRTIHSISPPPRVKVPDLTLAQIRIIRLLSDHGDCSMKELARRARITMPTATGLVDRLVRAGIVERVKDSNDRRVVKVRLSKRGTELVRRHRKWRLRNLGRLLERLSDAEREQVGEAIETLSRIFSKIIEIEAKDERHG